MKIESNEISKSYINTEATWTHGKEITLDGVKLIPITVIEDIKAEIESERSCLYEEKRTDLTDGMNTAHLTDLGIIDKHTKELMK